MNFSKYKLILSAGTIALTLVLFLGTSVTQAAVILKANFYELDSNLKTKAFHWTKELEKKSDSQHFEIAKSFDLSDKLLVKQTTEFKNDQFVQFEVEELQTKKKGLIKVKGEKVFFKYYENGKLDKEDDEKLKKNFVVPSTLISYIKKNWETLANGDTVKIRFGVWSRAETVGFKLFKERTFKDNETEVIEIKMKPSSFIIAALVDPLFFRFNKAGTRLLTMKGRVAPKKKKGKKWKDWDAEGVYEEVAKAK